MSDSQVESPEASPSEEEVFARRIGAKAARKQQALRAGDQGVWFGLRMSGLIGWSVAVPTVLGAVLGVWLDDRHPQKFSWTLTLLFAALVLQTQRNTADEPARDGWRCKPGLDPSSDSESYDDESSQTLDVDLWQATQSPWVVLQAILKRHPEGALTEPDFCQRLNTILQRTGMAMQPMRDFRMARGEARLTSVAYVRIVFISSEALDETDHGGSSFRSTSALFYV